MAVLVIDLALLVVGQHLIGLGGFLEFFLGGLIAGIFVRMILDSEFPVSFLYFILGRGFGHAQNFVIISFSH